MLHYLHDGYVTDIQTSQNSTIINFAILVRYG